MLRGGRLLFKYPQTLFHLGCWVLRVPHPQISPRHLHSLACPHLPSHTYNRVTGTQTQLLAHHLCEFCYLQAYNAFSCLVISDPHVSDKICVYFWCIIPQLLSVSPYSLSVTILFQVYGNSSPGKNHIALSIRYRESSLSSLHF